MTVRRERVILSLTDDYSGKVLRAATATKALKQAINDVDGEYVGAGQGARAFTREVDSNTSAIQGARHELSGLGSELTGLTRNVDRSSVAFRRHKGELDSYGGRLRLIAKAIATLGPGLVPMGGVGIVGITSLINQLGVLTTAGVGAVIAFQGVGDALGALNKASLEPTTANLEKAKQALDQLGPSAQALVGHLFELRDEWADLKNAGAEGLFPGVEAALTHLETRLPDFMDVLRAINTETGDLLAEGAQAIAGPQWDQFFDFVETDGADTLRDMGHALGNVTRGIAEMMMAFDPLNDDFSRWLVKVTRNFAEWSDGLSQTQGFQSFVEYVRETGPQVGATLGAITNAFIEIVKAAAPLGGPVLSILESIADTLAAVAASDIGTPILTALSAISLLSTAMRGFERTMTASLGLRGKRTVGEAFTGWSRDMKAALPTLQQTGTYLYRMGQSADHASKSTLAARKAVRGFGREFTTSIAPAAAGAATLGLVATGTTDKLGLTNTATLGLAGSLAGPLGAALGTVIGLFADTAALNDDLEEAMRRVDTAAKSGNLQAWADAVEAQRASVEGFAGSLNIAESALLGIRGVIEGKGLMTRGLDKILDEQDQQYLDSAQAAQDYRNAIQGLVAELDPETHKRWLEFGFTMEDLQRTFDAAGPAASRFGIDLDAALRAGPGTPEWNALVDAIRQYNATTDTVPGRTKAVGDALASIGSEIDSTTDKAAALSQALDALFGPALDQSEAADAQIRGIKELRKAIEAAAGDIFGRSDKNLDARDSIRGSVIDALNSFKADAAAGVEGDKLAAGFLRARDAIIDTAVAAGASKKDVEAFLNTLQMTPENLTTIITTPGLLNAQQQVAALGELYDMTPKEVRTLVAQLGMAKSQADVEELMRKYDLTRKDVLTLIKANADGAFSEIAALQQRLAGLNSKTVYVDVVTRSRTAVADGGTIGLPGGGTVPGQRQPYGDKVFAHLAPGEEVISNKYGQADRNRGLLKAINANRMAAGGTAGFPGVTGVPGGIVLDSPLKGLKHEFGSLTKAIKDLRRSVDKAEKKRSEILAARDTLVQSVRNRFDSPLFAGPTDPWAPGAGDFMSTLRDDIAGLRDENAAIKQLKRKGLSGGALATLLEQGDLSTVQELAGMSKAELAEYQRLFDRRAGLQGSVGAAAGQAAFGTGLAQANSELKEMNQRLRHLERLQEKANEHHEANARKTGEEVGRAVNGAASKGRRDQRG